MIPAETLEQVRNMAQPNARNSRKVPVVVIPGNQGPILETVGGKVCCTVGQNKVCGDYYDR